MKLTLEFLGTGTSVGVPIIGCDCAVCRSTDPRDKRLRSSALVRSYEAGENRTTVLIDTTPDFRQQMLRSDVRRIDAVIITHFHADHVVGIDDIRRFNMLQKQVIDLWGTPATLESMRAAFGYIFSETLRYGWPSIRAREIVIGQDFVIGDLRFTPFELDHAIITNTGLRIDSTESQPGQGGLCYCLDVKRVPENAIEAIRNADTLVIDMLREKSHPTHLNLEEALAVSERVKPRLTYLGHLAHEVSHAELESRLPPDIRIAYDGLITEFRSE